MILEVGINIGIKNLLEINSTDSVSILDPKLYAAYLTLFESLNNKVLGDDINIFSLAGFKLVFYYEMITLEEETQPLLFYTITDKNANVELVQLFLKRLISPFLNQFSLNDIFFKRPSFFNNFKPLIRDILNSLNLRLAISDDNIKPPDWGSNMLSDLFFKLNLKLLNNLNKNKAENRDEKVPELLNKIKKMDNDNRYAVFSRLIREIKGTKLIDENITEILDIIKTLPKQFKFRYFYRLVEMLEGTEVIRKNFADFLNVIKNLSGYHEKIRIFLKLIDLIKGTEAFEENFTFILTLIQYFSHKQKYGAFSILIKAIKGTKLIKRKITDLFRGIEELDVEDQYPALCKLITEFNDFESNNTKAINSLYEIVNLDKDREKFQSFLHLILAIERKKITKEIFTLTFNLIGKLPLKHGYWILLKLIDVYKGTECIKEKFTDIVNGIDYLDDEIKFEIYFRLILAIKGSEVIRENFAYYLKELDKVYYNINFKAFSTLIITIEGSEVIKKKFIKLLTETIKISKYQIKQDKYTFFFNFIDKIEETKTIEKNFTEILNGLDKIPNHLKSGAFSILIEATKGTKLIKNNVTKLLRGIEKLEYRYSAFCELLNEIKGTELIVTNLTDLINSIENLNEKDQYSAFRELINLIKGNVVTKEKFIDLLNGIANIYYDGNNRSSTSLIRELVSDFTETDLKEVIINLARKNLDETLFFFLDAYFLLDKESIGLPFSYYLNKLYDDENDDMINLLIKTGYIYEPLTRIENEDYLIDLLSNSPKPVVDYLIQEMVLDRYLSEREWVLLELVENGRYSVIEFLFESEILQPADNVRNEHKDSIIFDALNSGNSSVMYYLINERYFEDISIEEIESLYINSNFKEKISKALWDQGSKRLNGPLIPLELLKILIDMGSFKSKVILLEEMKEIMERNSESYMVWLVGQGFLNYYDDEKKKKIINEQIENADYQMVSSILVYENSSNLKKLEKIIKNSESRFRKSLTVALLNRKIAKTRIFPLLKKLSELGYSRAKKLLKKEILKRISLGNKSDFLFFFDNYYLSYFTSEEFDEFLNSSPSSIENLIKVFSDRFDLDFHNINSVTLNSKTNKYEIMLKEIRNELISKKGKMSEVIFNLWVKKLNFYIENLTKFKK